MKPAIASTVSGSEAQKIARQQTSIQVLQSDLATQETVGERLQREVEEKLNKTSPERLAPLKAVVDITKAQMAQLKDMINSRWPHDPGARPDGSLRVHLRQHEPLDASGFGLFV